MCPSFLAGHRPAGVRPEGQPRVAGHRRRRHLAAHGAEGGGVPGGEGVPRRVPGAAQHLPRQDHGEVQLNALFFPGSQTFWGCSRESCPVCGACELVFFRLNSEETTSPLPFFPPQDLNRVPPSAVEFVTKSGSQFRKS